MTSPIDTEKLKKKSKITLDTDADTDTEYLSAAELSISDTATMETTSVNNTSSLQRPITAFTTTVTKTSGGAKYVLTVDERDDIANRVHLKLKEDLSELIAQSIAQAVKPLQDELSATRKLFENEIVKNAQLQQEINDLKLQVDEQEQYSRRSCLRINGIIGDEGIQSENVEAKLLTLAETNGIAIKSEDIDIAHRLGRPRPGFTRPVIVKFSNTKAKQRVLAARKTLGNVYINEDLTRFRQTLHYHARALVREKKLERTWVAGGKIFCVFSTDPVGPKLQIRSMEDIENIRKSQHPRSAPNRP